MRRGNYGIDPERLGRLVAERADARAARIAERLRLGAAKAKVTLAAKRDAEFLERAKKRKVAKQVARGRKVTEPRGILAGWKLLAAAMRPGWYALPDMIKLSGAPSGSVKPWVYQQLAPRGFLERAENPEWDPEWPARRQSEPRYLWRLTQAGQEARLGWLAEMGGVEGDRAPPPFPAVGTLGAAPTATLPGDPGIEKPSTAGAAEGLE